MKMNKDLYGCDMTDTADMISDHALHMRMPTLDIHGEMDPRAVSEGNHGTQGGGKSSQGEKMSGSDMGGGGAGEQDMDGGT